MRHRVLFWVVAVGLLLPWPVDAQTPSGDGPVVSDITRIDRHAFRAKAHRLAPRDLPRRRIRTVMSGKEPRKFDSMGANVLAIAPRRCVMVDDNPIT